MLQDWSLIYPLDRQLVLLLDEGSSAGNHSRPSDFAMQKAAILVWGHCWYRYGLVAGSEAKKQGLTALVCCAHEIVNTAGDYDH